MTKKIKIGEKVYVSDEVVIKALLTRIDELKDAAYLYAGCNEKKKDYLIDQESNYYHDEDDRDEQEADFILVKGIRFDI